MYEKLQLICNYFWQESSAGLWSVMTGTLWSRQPYPDHWYFVDGFSCLSFIVAWQCGMPTVSFIAALAFEKSLYRRTCPLDNVFFRRNWRLIALFKAAKVSSFGLVVFHGLCILRLSNASDGVFTDNLATWITYSRKTTRYVYSAKCTES